MSQPEHRARPSVLAVVGGLMTEGPDLSSCEDLADIRFAASSEEVAAGLPDAEVVFVWDYRFADLRAALPSANRLRWVHAASVGVEPLLSEELRQSGAMLTNSRGVFDDAIAEYVVMLALVQAKDFRTTLACQAAKQWSHRLTGVLEGRRAVVVGTGSIGRTIARRLAAFDVRVTLVGRVTSDDPEFGRVEASTELAAVSASADFLVLAVPLTAQTRHMVDDAVLASLGADGYLINVGRGGLVDTGALVDALRDGALAGAALDTFEVEPLQSASALWEMPNVVVSPHMSGDFAGYDARLVEVFRENLDRFVSGRPLANLVDQDRGYVPSTAS